MKDWNTVVTLYEEEGAGRRAHGVLAQLGEVAQTHYHNVLVMRVEHVEGFLRDFTAMCEAAPGILDDISRVLPAAETFDFADAEEFEAKARQVALSWVPRLHDRSFYVRLYRRGLKGALSTTGEERFLNETLLNALEAAGAPGKVQFENPDVVIDVETVGHRAGLSLWTREKLARYLFLKIR